MNVTHEDVMEIIKNTGAATDVSQIEGDTSLNEVGIDSLDMANLLLSIEEKYKIKIADEDMEQLDSVNAIVRYMSNR